MKYNDIDSDVLYYVEKGLPISEILEEHCVNNDQYLALLLLMPNIPIRRCAIHTFLEVFTHQVYNELEYREDLERFELIESEIKYYIYFETSYKPSIEEPLDPSYYYIEYYGIIDTDLPSKVKEWLNKECQRILTDRFRIEKLKH